MLENFKAIGNEIRLVENEIKAENNPEDVMKEKIDDAEDIVEDVLYCRVDNISDLENCKFLRDKVNIIRKLNLFNRPVKVHRKIKEKRK